MTPPKTAARILAEELCAKYPDHSNLGLAKKLRTDHPECFSSAEQARGFIRIIRGAHGNDRKRQATQPRPKGHAGTKPKCPPSFEDEWEVFDLGSEIDVGILSDAHIPYHVPLALESGVADLKKRNPDVILINGDWCDFYQVSRWQRDPSKRRFSEELKVIKASLEWLRSEFPKKRIIMKAGNHEERWDHFIWNRAPEIYDLANVQLPQLVELAKFGIEYVADQRIIMAGKLPILHGHEFGSSSFFSPVNPARGAFLRTNHTVLVGHSHQTSSHADSDLMHSETFVWSVGCLCGLTPAYRRTNKWNHGCAFVEVAKDGSFDVSNMRIAKDGTVRKS
jgi:predicted phosphodiesterase